MDKYSDAWRNICRIVRDFTNAPHFKKTLFWGVALHLIALFALLRGDIYYADDYINSSSDGFWNHSRYFATLILSLLATFGKGTMDISPLPQILGVIFIVISAMILLYVIRKKFDFIGVLASLSLGLSPHFLQNLSYKFDAITMGIALFFAILPFLFHTQRRIFCAVSVVCLILMFMTYQAANATYIILSLYFALFLRTDFKQGAKFLGVCALNLIIASLIYGLFIDTTNLSIGDAYATHEVVAPNADFLMRVAQNLATYFATIFSDLKNTPFIYLIALNCALFAINAMLCKGRRIYAFFRAILFLTLGFIASYGLYAVLAMPIFEARVFYGLNALIAVICIANISQFAESAESTAKSVADSAESGADSTAKSNAESTADSTESTADSTKSSKILRPLSLASIAITAYFLISFANIYGNALKKQVEFLDFRSEMLLRDLGAVPKSNRVLLSVETLSGEKHPVAQRFSEKYGGISRILPTHYLQSHLSNGWHYDSGGVCDVLPDGEVVKRGEFYEMRKVGMCYVVRLL